MPKEVILHKLRQMRELLQELSSWCATPFLEFQKNSMMIRAAERNFQLIVEFASDINSQLILERDHKTPETYWQSFDAMGKLKLLPSALIETLKNSAKLRNILVHEYDFEADEKKFYDGVKKAIPAYEEYIIVITQLLTRN